MILETIAQPFPVSSESLQLARFVFLALRRSDRLLATLAPLKVRAHPQLLIDIQSALEATASSLLSRVCAVEPVWYLHPKKAPGLQWMMRTLPLCTLYAYTHTRIHMSWNGRDSDLYIYFKHIFN